MTGAAQMAGNIPSADLIVIGGGIHGCATAMYAALRGLSVILLEKETVARHASGVNAGGVRRLGRHYEEVAISQRAMELWYGLQDFVGADCGFNIAPQIRVIETEDELENARQRVKDLNEMGFDHEVILEQNELREYLPAVSDHVLAGLACIEDGFAQPFHTTFAIAQKAKAEGVRIYEQCRATGLKQADGVWSVETSQGAFKAPKVLVAGGAWGNELSSSVGEPVPLEDCAPMMIVTSRLPHFCDAVVSALGRPLSFKQMPNGTVVIGGGRRGRADRNTNLSEILFDELHLTAETAADIFPIMREASIVRTWSGVESILPDGIPVIGPSAKHEGLYYSFGYSTHGFQLGPGCGEVMAELIATGETKYSLDAFAVNRFAA